jgi:USP6 N-terminal-like protein
MKHLRRLTTDLLAAPSANFESILSLLSSYFVAEDEDALMRFIRKMLGQAGLRARMDRWRDEWTGLVREGKSGSALL